MNTLQENLVLAKESTDPTVLTGLAADRNNGVVRLVGSNEATPPAILSILVNHQNPSVREWTIKNPSTPLDRINDIRDRDDLPKVKTAIQTRLAGPTGASADPRVKGTPISDGTGSAQALVDQFQQVGSTVEAKVGLR